MTRPASWLLVSLTACRPTTATEASDPTTATEASDPTTATEASDPRPASALQRRSESSVASESPDPVAVRINERYARSDAGDWDSFEREGREVFDHRTRIVDALALAPGDVVADVGAGTGLFTLEFARRVGPRGRVFAVDVQPYFRKHIAERAAVAELDNITTVAADQRHSGLAADSVDVAFLCDAYHHLELPQTYLADLRRALRPGARLVVVDYDRTRAGADAWTRKHVRADPAQFRREIEDAGFRLVDTPALLRENFVMIFERPADAER